MTSKGLEVKIQELKVKRQNDFHSLVNQLDQSYKELTPSNIIKNTIGGITKKTLLNKESVESLISIAGGYLSKLLIIGKSNSKIKSLFGYLIQIATTKLISTKISK